MKAYERHQLKRVHSTDSSGPESCPSPSTVAESSRSSFGTTDASLDGKSVGRDALDVLSSGSETVVRYAFPYVLEDLAHVIGPPTA